MTIVEKFIVAMISMTMFRYSKTSPCNSYLCFTWKVNMNELTLNCKINDLHLRVLIGDQFGNIQADCLPPTSSSNCEPYYQNGTIIQNRKTNETIYIVKGKIDRHINGNWTCRHGTRRDVARVEVTVFKENNTNSFITGYTNATCKFKESNFDCLKTTLLYTVITLLVSVSLSLVILSCVKYSPVLLDDLLFEKSNCCSCITKLLGGRLVSVCKSTCFTISIAVFLGFSILISLLDDKKCTSQWVFIGLGIIFGIFITILFLSKGDKEDDNGTSTSASPGAENEQTILVEMETSA
ncbi:uncharacterized protein [Mytilus edulis]|uniref:uncharacterized protein n=1 Tax=Mytilus edulis TaxID=6550 RepID=UPI0039EFC9D5